MRKSVSISCPSFRATLKNIRRAACGLLATLAFTMPVHAVDLLYVSMSDNTIATFDVSSGIAATIASSVSTFATIPGTANGIVFDSSNNLYVSTGADAISKVTTGGAVSQFATGLTGPLGLTIDSGGNLYVANIANNSISKITTGGSVSSFATGMSSPYGLTADSSGNIYVANSTTNTIAQITPGGSVSTFATGLSSPSGLTIDSSGNLYVASLSGAMSKITSGGTVSSFATGLNNQRGITIDSSGNLYVANSAGGQSISKYDSAGTLLFTFSTGALNPNFLTFGATAVPEPSTYALGVIAAGVMGAIARRRKARKTA